MKLAAQFFGAQCLLEKISVRDCLAFRNTLTALPPNHSKNPEYKSLDIRAAAALAQKLGEPGRAPQTLKNQLGELCRLFDHAERFQYIHVSPIFSCPVRVRPGRRKSCRRNGVETIMSIDRTAPLVIKCHRCCKTESCHPARYDLGSSNFPVPRGPTFGSNSIGV